MAPVTARGGCRPSRPTLTSLSGEVVIVSIGSRTVVSPGRVTVISEIKLCREKTIAKRVAEN